MGSAVNAFAVRLTWQRPNMGVVTGYNITYYPVNGATMNLTDIVEGGSTLSKTIGDLSASTTYRFILRATNMYGASGSSNIVDVTTLVQSGK